MFLNFISLAELSHGPKVAKSRQRHFSPTPQIESYDLHSVEQKWQKEGEGGKAFPLLAELGIFL